ncbi:MAG TPA: hypothetical protein VHB51_02260 [Candidatus Saccharimonadales bacterium]|nr:hypothetical protein [Candidatus Saccharimonadales bacterium]
MDPNETPPTNPNESTEPESAPEPSDETSIPVNVTPSVPAASSATARPSASAEPAATTAPESPALPEASAAPSAQPTVSSDAAAAAPGAKRSMKGAFVAVVAVLVLAIGSAAAYVGIIVPNKPENLLKSAIDNTLNSKGGQFAGVVSVKPTSGAGVAAKVEFNGGANTTAKTAAFKVNADVSGVSFPVETRLVSGDFYFKLGDLSQLGSLAQSFNPSAGSLVQELSGQVSKKWFKVDSTALDSAGVGCFTNANWSLSTADAKLIESNYKDHPFTTITSTSRDTINGKKAEKMVLSIDDDKLSTYLKNLKFDQLSLFKQLHDCNKALTPKNDYKDVADHDKTPLTLWIDKGSKQIVQISGGSTPKDSKTVKTTVTITLNHTLPTITAPAGAHNYTELVASLSKAFGGSGFDPISLFSGDLGGTQARADDSKRQADIQSLQVQMEAFFAENGYYPSLTDMNNAKWRADNMPSLDSSALQDPSGTSQTLSAAPGKGVYSYQVTNANGGSCESNDKTCAKYTLTATFDGRVNGQSTYTKNSLN